MNCHRDKRLRRKCAGTPIGSTHKPTDKACILLRRFNAHADYIALPAPLLLRRRVFEIAMTHGRGQSTWIFIIAPSSMVWQAGKLACLDNVQCVYCCVRKRKREMTKERLAHRLDYAPLIAELARKCYTLFPLLSQPTFQLYLLSGRLKRCTKNPGPAGMINEGSGRKRGALALAFSSSECGRETRGSCAFITADRNGRKHVCIERTRERNVILRTGPPFSSA